MLVSMRWSLAANAIRRGVEAVLGRPPPLNPLMSHMSGSTHGRDACKSANGSGAARLEVGGEANVHARVAGRERDQAVAVEALVGRAGAHDPPRRAPAEEQARRAVPPGSVLGRVGAQVASPQPGASLAAQLCQRVDVVPGRGDQVAVACVDLCHAAGKQSTASQQGASCSFWNV